ncbi:hypothetical protein KIN20_033474, partial [Parelaphostrongylus tenuis]
MYKPQTGISTLQEELAKAETGKKKTLFVHEMEERKAKISRIEDVLKTMEEQANSKKEQMALELENMTNDIQQQQDIISRLRETYMRASENVKKQIERFTRLKQSFVAHEKLCQSIAEKQKELLKLKEHHWNPSKEIEEKREKSLKEANIERQNADINAVELSAADLEERNCKLEAEIESLKAQLSVKTRELEIGKVRFQESATKVGNRCGQQQNEVVSTGDRKTDRHKVQTEDELTVPLKKQKQGAQQYLSEEVKICSQPNISKTITKKWRWNIVKDNKIQCVEKKNEVNNVNGGRNDQSACHLGREIRPTKAGYVEVEGDRSSSLRSTKTLASILAEKKKRDIAADWDDSVVEEDDGGDLFASPENDVYNISEQNTTDTTLEADPAGKS